MKLQKTAITIFLTILTLGYIQAQSYNNAVGLRLGASNGISFKHFISQANAVEVIANTRWRGFQLTGLYERHQSIAQSEKFNFYYGAGTHVGFWNDYDNHPWFDDNKNSSEIVAGLDAVIGIEYAFNSIPFALSLDWKPEFNIIGYSGVWVGDTGLSVRYYW